MRRWIATAALFVVLLASALPAAGAWVGERLCATGLPRGGEFGSAVAAGDGGTIAVGDFRHDTVYLFTWDDENGCRATDVIRGRAGEWFGFDLAIDGDRLLIGAPRSGGTGAVYLYDLKTESLKSIAVPQAQRGDEVGSSVAMDRGTLAIGARGTDGRRGRVYVGREGDLTAVPTPSGLAQGAELGQSVALSGNLLVMGAPSPFRASGSPGAAWVYDVQSGELFPLASPDRLEPEAAFGYAVAVDGDRILVGAPLVDRDGADVGAVFRFEGRGRGPAQELGFPRRVGDQLGVAVALEGETVVAGARYAAGTRGAAYLLEGNGPSQTLEQTVPGGAQLGFSLAIHGDVVVVGAFREGGTGAAYLFQQVSAVELVVPAEIRESETRLPVILRTRDGRPAPGDLTFRLRTLPGTAEERSTPGEDGDYLRLEREVVLRAGQTATSVEAQLYPDTVCEERETFQVILSELSGARLQTEDVAILDDDASGGLELSPALLQTSEEGTPAALSVRLTCPPSANVILSLSSSDGTEGLVAPDRLRFTPDNWARAQTVQVAGQDDALCDGVQTYTIGMTATSADPRFAGLSQPLPAENADDELACLAAAMTVCTDGGGTVVYTITLANAAASAPEAPAELLDVLPPEVSVVTASADRGIATADPVDNSVRWTGTVPAAGVTITIVAALDVPPGPEVKNHADVTYVRDAGGHLETVSTEEVVFVAGEVIPCPF